jgi:hypothetical protein
MEINENDHLPPSFLELEEMESYEWRRDLNFCQLIDQGMDPGDAYQKADHLARQPLLPLDYGLDDE